MKMIRMVAVFAALLISAQASAVNPHFKILRAKENFVKNTQLGKLFAGFYEDVHGPELILFDSIKNEYESKKRRGKKVLRLNWALHASSHEYLSWILFQGLVHHELKKRLGEVYLPHLIEKDYYIFKKSMQYLDQSGMIVSDDMDYANHPTFNFGRNRLLSITLFYDLWLESERRFLKAVWVRRQKLSGKVLSVLDYLERPNLSPDQRAAATKLKELWYNY